MVATITHWSEHASIAPVWAGPAAAWDRTGNDTVTLPSPLVRTGCAASSAPQPRSLAAAAVAHSEIRTVLFGGNPDTVTLTGWPSIRLAAGLTETCGPAARRPIS